METKKQRIERRTPLEKKKGETENENPKERAKSQD